MRDCNCDAVGGELEQVDLVPREGATLERADVAGSPIGLRLDDERDADQADDSLAADQRVEDVGMLDVGEHDRTQLGSHMPGEAVADRDVECRLELVLDP